MPIAIPRNALVMLVGASASGKSYWAHSHFRDTEVVSSDRCRALVADDEANQQVNREAFAVFYTIVRQRLRLGRLTVADSTGLEPFARGRLRSLAAEHFRPVHAVVFVAPPERVLAQNRRRDRRVPEEVLARHVERVRELVEGGVLELEGYAGVHYLREPREVAEPPELLPALPPPPPAEAKDDGSAPRA